ncbi:MAG TPA: PP2C family protein-serine/threonine phosphatase, partial [Longimicrobiales bacterium]
GHLVYSNAGHPHAFVVRSDGAPERLAATSPPLGIVPFNRYGEAAVDWHGGDLLCLFTDGLSDAIATGQSGESRVLETVGCRRAEPVKQILEGVFDIPNAANGLPADDRTAVLVRV